MGDKSELLWVERYRPDTIDEIILPERFIKVAQGYIDKGELPNMTFAGSPGTGKTTLAKVLGNQLGYDVLYVNGSQEGRLFETLRNKISQFATTVSLVGARKMILLDEADNLPLDTIQPALRGFIESTSNNCSYILTCNMPNKIMDALRSRCPVVNFQLTKEDKLPMIKRFLARVKEILAENNVPVESDKILAEFIAKNYPDWRATLNKLQNYAASGRIDAGILASDEMQIDELIKHLKAKNFVEVRKWVATSPNLDMTTLCRSLYNRLDTHVKNESKPAVIITLADYQYKNAFVSDPEINIMAMLIQIMVECEWLN